MIQSYKLSVKELINNFVEIFLQSKISFSKYLSDH